MPYEVKRVSFDCEEEEDDDTHPETDFRPMVRIQLQSLPETVFVTFVALLNVGLSVLAFFRGCRILINIFTHCFGFSFLSGCRCCQDRHSLHNLHLPGINSIEKLLLFIFGLIIAQCNHRRPPVTARNSDWNFQQRLIHNLANRSSLLRSTFQDFSQSLLSPLPLVFALPNAALKRLLLPRNLGHGVFPHSPQVLLPL